MNPIEGTLPSLSQSDLMPTLSELESYRNLFDHAPIGYLLLNAEDRIQLVNLTLAQMLQADRADLRARHLADFIAPEDLPRFQAHVTLARQHQTVQRSYFTLRFADQRFPVLAESQMDPGCPTSIQMVLTNISREKIYFDQLSESEARYRLLFEKSADFIFIHEMLDGNIPGPFLEVNTAACERLGYTHAELIARSPFDIVHQSELGNLPGRGEHLVATGSNLFEQVLVSKDGREIPVEMHTHVVEWQGQPTILTIARDLTKRRNAERQAERLRADYDTIFDSVQDAIFLIKVEENGQFRYIRTNTYHQDRTGISLEQIRHKTPKELVGEEVGNLIAQNYRRCVDAGAPISYEEELLLGGTLRTWLTTLTPVAEDGRINYIVGSSVDITERIQAERALRESETRFRDLFEYSSIAYQSLDVDGRFIDANPQLCTLLGYRRDELVGRPFGDFWHPDTQALFPECFRAFVANGAIQAELQLIHKNGDSVTVLLNGRIQHDGAGKFLRTHCVLYNITERKHAEAQAFALALEQERLRLLTHFIQSASHEFMTPLAVIHANAHLLSHVEIVEKRARYYGQIEEQVALLRKLVDMLMEIVKLESNEALKRRIIDTGDFVRSLCDSFRTRLPTPGLSCQIAADLPPLYGDESYLRKAISHILENAYRFTPAHGAIVVRCQDSDKGIEILVQDSGLGIDAEALPHIFDTFWRQDHAHTTPGLGLGLSLSQKIIQLHGGRIEAESEPGQGSIFRVILPSFSDQ